MCVLNRAVQYFDVTNKSSSYTVECVPEELEKKTTLLLYFARYMDEHLIQVSIWRNDYRIFAMFLNIHCHIHDILFSILFLSFSREAMWNFPKTPTILGMEIFTWRSGSEPPKPLFSTLATGRCRYSHDDKSRDCVKTKDRLTWHLKNPTLFAGKMHIYMYYVFWFFVGEFLWRSYQDHNELHEERLLCDLHWRGEDCKHLLYDADHPRWLSQGYCAENELCQKDAQKLSRYRGSGYLNWLSAVSGYIFCVPLISKYHVPFVFQKELIEKLSKPWYRFKEPCSIDV